MKLKFEFGNTFFAYTQNVLWWGSINNTTMHLNGRVISYKDYLKTIKRL